MSRQAILLTVLGFVLVVVVFFFFLFQPKQNQIAELEEEAATLRTQQQTTQNDIERLEAVRATAPELEAEIAAAEAIVPTDTSLPALLRGLQTAADDSGLQLTTVAPARPQPVDEEGAPEGLARIDLSVTVDGGYYQTVDFLRRLEDPALTARGVLWGGLNVTKDLESYPTLTTTVSGTVFAVLPGGEVAEEPAPAETPTDGSDVDVDVDVDVETEVPGAPATTDDVEVS